MDIEDKLLISIEEDYKSLVLALKKLEEELYRNFINNGDINLYNEANIVVNRLKNYIQTCNFFVNEIEHKNKSLLSAYEELVEDNKILKQAIKLAEINQRAYKELYEKIIKDIINDELRIKNDK